MATVYYDRDADPTALRGKTIAVIGYGSQGHAHAQNLRDSGHDVIVGLQAGSRSWAKAEEDRFAVRETADAARGADVIALLVPDQHHRTAYERIKPQLRAHEGELRHARRRGLSARGRVLRVRERDEAHRRPHLRGRPLVHALLGVGHR